MSVKNFKLFSKEKIIALKTHKNCINKISKKLDVTNNLSRNYNNNSA